jgi:hypothetical protein
MKKHNDNEKEDNKDENDYYNHKPRMIVVYERNVLIFFLCYRLRNILALDGKIKLNISEAILVPS